MEKFRVIIIDDEKHVIEIIKDFLLMLYPNEAQIVAEAQNYEDAILALQHHEADILFIDINIQGGKTGFDVLDNVKEDVRIHPIFVTAFDEFAIKAFKYEAIDYLLKPFVMSEFNSAVERALERKKNKSVNSTFKILQELVINKEKTDRIFISDKNGFNIVSIDDIIYLEADGSYCSIIMRGSVRINASRNMKYILAQIDDHPNIIKVHKSFAVNKKNVTNFLGAKNLLIMNDGSEVPVTLTQKELMALIT